MLIAQRTCNPFPWFYSPQDKQKQQHHYHYQTAPVPGIYWCNGPSNRYLVAIKPNGNKGDNLFASPRLNKGSLPRPFDQFSKPVSQASSTVTWGSNTTVTSSTKSVSFATEIREGITSSIRTKHDKKPLSEKNHFKEFKNEKANFNHITREDCFGGYRRVVEPLKVQYNKVLERWMFKTEIEERTIRIYMCTSEKCESERHEHCAWQCAKACGSLKCGTLIEREMFALDDAKTWIITGDLKSRKINGDPRCESMVERSDVNLRNCGLFCLTRWEGLRRMSDDEACKRRRELSKMARGPTRCVAESTHPYTKVVNYLVGARPSYGTALDLKMEFGLDDCVESDEVVGSGEGVGLC